MLHTCDQRFDVTGNLEIFCELNEAYISPIQADLSISYSGVLSSQMPNIKALCITYSSMLTFLSVCIIGSLLVYCMCRSQEITPELCFTCRERTAVSVHSVRGLLVSCKKA